MTFISSSSTPAIAFHHRRTSQEGTATILPVSSHAKHGWTGEERAATRTVSSLVVTELVNTFPHEGTSQKGAVVILTKSFPAEHGGTREKGAAATTAIASFPAAEHGGVEQRAGEQRAATTSIKRAHIPAVTWEVVMTVPSPRPFGLLSFHAHEEVDGFSFPLAQLAKRLPQFIIGRYAYEVAILVAVAQLHLTGVLLFKEASYLVPQVDVRNFSVDGEATRFATVGHFDEHHRQVLELVTASRTQNDDTRSRKARAYDSCCLPSNLYTIL